MTINELAKKIADEFKADMKEHGFETFKEMAKCYWWDATDVKGEISYMATDFANRDYDEYVEANGTWNGYEMVTVYDDCSVSGRNDENKLVDMTYGNFKKLVLGYVK